jgi:hypothetical protein
MFSLLSFLFSHSFSILMHLAFNVVITINDSIDILQQISPTFKIQIFSKSIWLFQFNLFDIVFKIQMYKLIVNCHN